jgi:hypothetical protein
VQSQSGKLRDLLDTLSLLNRVEYDFQLRRKISTDTTSFICLIEAF